MIERAPESTSAFCPLPSDVTAINAAFAQSPGHDTLALPMRIHTIGHSTRELEELVALLRENGIGRLPDIRRSPGSRPYPHFSPQSLPQPLPEHTTTSITTPP